MDGVLIIDKPAGLTSHDVVTRARGLLQQSRVGHTGTLDPFATGVLVLLFGRATRLAQFLSGAEKEYEAVIRFGYATDTGDFTGKPITDPSERTFDGLTQVWSGQEIEAALESLRGEIDQVPPMYSAKKRGGKKFYEYARRGEQVERIPVRVTVRAFEVVSFSDELLRNNADGTVDLAVRVVCSAGTYIRTLAESLGNQLGVGAHLAELRRTRAGNFHISEAVRLEQLKEKVVEKSLGTVLRPPDEALSHMPFVCLSASDGKRVRHGMAVPIEQHSGGIPADGENIRIRDDTEQLVAIACYDARSKSLRPRIVIASE